MAIFWFLNPFQILIMKNFLISITILFSFSSIAQNNQLESLSSVKLGLLGSWLAYEQPVSNKILINAEVGYEFGIYSDVISNGTQFLATSTFSLEPRYYYNLEKRKAAGKSTMLNAGNYIALEIQASPNWGTYATDNVNDASITPTAVILPKIGMKRTLGKSVTFELAGGLGYQFTENGGNRLAVGLDLMFGFLPKIF
jgi:hypothetical protein